MTDFSDRLQSALRRRLYPNSALHIKQLAGAIGTSGDTVRRIAAGETRAYGDNLAALAEFFAGRGDHGFIDEVYGRKTPTVDSSLRALVREVLSEQRRSQQCVWATPEGIREADDGHEAYARRELGLSPNVSGDCRLYAMRNLGYVEITIDADNLIHIRYSARGAKSQAALSALDWLLARRDKIASVSRSTEVSGEWLRAPGLTIDAVADELLLVSNGEASPCRKSDRRSLEEISSPKMAALMRGWVESPSLALNVAGAVGVSHRISIFSALNENVICRWFGPGLDLPRNAVGKDVSEWSDPLYAADIRRRVLATEQDGPTFWQVDSPLFGKPMSFGALMQPLGNGDVIVMTERRVAA